MSLEIEVIYCEACGYKAKYEVIRRRLEQEFPGKLEITSFGTLILTGWLEVQIVGGKLLHSKKNGDGYVDTEEKMSRIIAGVKEALGQ